MKLMMDFSDNYDLDRAAIDRSGGGRIGGLRWLEAAAAANFEKWTLLAWYFEMFFAQLDLNHLDCGDCGLFCDICAK